jgi:hypothetical protein
MKIIPIELNLAERDLCLYKIAEQIKYNRNLLMRKKRELEKKYKSNHYLEIVKKDYEHYYNYILNEKQQQYKAMKMIQSYLNNLVQTNQIANEELKNTKEEQKRILREVDKIKEELDDIIKHG